MANTISEAEQLITKVVGSGAQRIRGKVTKRNGNIVADNLTYSTPKGKFQVLLSDDKVFLIDSDGKKHNAYDMGLADEESLLSANTQKFFHFTGNHRFMWELQATRGGELVGIPTAIGLLSAFVINIVVGIIWIIIGLPFGAPYWLTVLALWGVPNLIVIPGYIIGAFLFRKKVRNTILSDLTDAGYHVLGGIQANYVKDSDKLNRVWFKAINPEKSNEASLFTIREGATLEVDPKNWSPEAYKSVNYPL